MIASIRLYQAPADSLMFYDRFNMATANKASAPPFPFRSINPHIGCQYGPFLVIGLEVTKSIGCLGSTFTSRKLFLQILGVTFLFKWHQRVE